MAQKVILYIQSDPNDANSYVKVDLYKDETVSLTMTLQDVRDIEKVRTDFSQPFTIPASDQNNLLFQHWYNPDIIGFNSNYRALAKLELNYLPFRQGFIRLNSVKMKDNKAQFYNITFLGETVDLKNIISEDQISQLTWLNSQGFVFANNNASAKQGLNNGLNKTVDGVQYDKAFIYPLISHSVAFNYKSNPPSGEINYTNLYSAPSGASTSSGCFYNDLKPAIRVDLILKAIENRYTIANGYTSHLTFSNDFFFTSATENLYLWMSRNKGPMKGGGRITTSNLAKGVGIQAESLGPFRPFFGGYWNPSQFYFCDEQGELNINRECYNPTWVSGQFNRTFLLYIRFGTYPRPFYLLRAVRLTYKITPSAGFESVPYTVQVLDEFNNVTISESIGLQGTQEVVVNRVNNSSYSSVPFPNFNPSASDVVGLNYSADIVVNVVSDDTFAFEFEVNQEYYGPINYINYINNDCTVTEDFIYVRGVYRPGGTIQLEIDVIPTQQLPEIKILDFLTGLFKTFNLTAYFEDGVTVVKTLDDFYSDFNNWDLTKLVHAEEHTVSESLPFSEINFTYPEPKSILAQTFEQVNNRKYGELRFVAEASKQGTYEVKSPFEHMLFERMNDESTGDLLSIQQGTFLDDNLNASFGKPLLFYAVENSDNSNDFINWINGIRPVDVTAQPSAGTVQRFRNYFMASNSNAIGTSTTAPTSTLNFGSEINTYTLTDYGGNNNSLFQNYYTN